MPNRYAVMGNPVAHSLSPAIHQLFAKETGIKLVYDKIQIIDAQFEQQVQDFFNAGGLGLNITLPCKERAFAMSEEPTARCLQAKAANTLWMNGGKLQADNTDGIGLLRDLSRYTHLAGKRILLVGAGGAARGIIGPLLGANPAHLTIANRTPDKAHRLQKEFPQISSSGFIELDAGYDVVINATASGHRHQPLALPEMVFTAHPFCYDLAYCTHDPTDFVALAQGHDCMAVDGFGMLVEQAAEAFYTWHGVRPDTASVLATQKMQ